MNERRNPEVSGLHVIVLAAGKASRYGSAKLLAPVHDRPMVLHAIHSAASVVKRASITVVLGACAAEIEPLVSAESVATAFNAQFDEGVASSIRTGMSQVPAATRGVMILLADQIAVTAGELQRLVDRWQERPDLIVAAHYDDSVGAPAIFPSDVFPELGTLRGDRGARALLVRHARRVIAVPMPSAGFDVDTPSDLARYDSQGTDGTSDALLFLKNGI